eukprot:CAMPEP_0195160796 /NCGR_PEP_ID=MMETSP0448-20130528/186844_1 /TAXON_ID=66468 /ORGANISM="Heterocapsa triquestra, Strain CCMP 448" /LENGTH=400 /DNA_ID=CAMNT_0040199597 /DNA_START=220 /DNA_END=1419 /DNA_ORIENTATION=+
MFRTSPGNCPGERSKGELREKNARGRTPSPSQPQPLRGGGGMTLPRELPTTRLRRAGGAATWCLLVERHQQPGHHGDDGEDHGRPDGGAPLLLPLRPRGAERGPQADDDGHDGDDQEDPERGRVHGAVRLEVGAGRCHLLAVLLEHHPVRLVAGVADDAGTMPDAVALHRDVLADVVRADVVNGGVVVVVHDDVLRGGVAMVHGVVVVLVVHAVEVPRGVVLRRGRVGAGRVAAPARVAAAVVLLPHGPSGPPVRVAVVAVVRGAGVAVHTVVHAGAGVVVHTVVHAGAGVAVHTVVHAVAAPAGRLDVEVVLAAELAAAAHVVAAPLLLGAGPALLPVGEARRAVVGLGGHAAARAAAAGVVAAPGLLLNGPALLPVGEAGVAVVGLGGHGAARAAAAG